jgi:hypothetical protein
MYAGKVRKIKFFTKARPHWGDVFFVDYRAQQIFASQEGIRQKETEV